MSWYAISAGKVEIIGHSTKAGCYLSIEMDGFASGA